MEKNVLEYFKLQTLRQQIIDAGADPLWDISLIWLNHIQIDLTE